MQHAELFGRIKGLRGRPLRDWAEYLLTSLDLTPYRNVNAMNLSGGNMRKVCVMITLIGNPAL